MPKGIKIFKTGDVGVMEWIDFPLSERGPGDNEVRIKQTCIGVNYIDIYHRSGVYPVSVPCSLGLEGVGRVVALGQNVSGFSVGERVGYATTPIGAYVEERDFPSNKLVKIPDYINDDVAAGVLLKGMTVEYLFNRTHRIKQGEYFLFHAAAGGVGLIACQWAKALGAKMIGTVGSDKKADLAKKAGCDYIINYKKQNVEERVKEITEGKGVGVVYDGVGKDTFYITLSCLKDRGLFVSFGQASGMMDKVDLHSVFAPKNLYYTRPSLMIYNKTTEELKNSSGLLFDMIRNNKIIVTISDKYKLRDAAQAHIDLQSRKTFGSVVLIP